MGTHPIFESDFDCLTEMSEPEDSDEYEDLLPCEVYKRLKIAWLNEKMAPELLENDEDVTENALELIKAMERNLKQNRDPTSKIRHSLHSLDVDRVRYVLTSYMRERINKIEQRPAHILHSEQRRSLLSEKELEFAEHLIGCQIEHLQSEVFNKVERWANEGFGLGQMSKWGKHFADDKYVILKFLEDFSLADVIEIADDERHHKCGDQVILLWKYGKEAIIKGAACLI